MTFSRSSVIAASMFLSVAAYGQGRGEPGKSIGSVAVRGNLIVMTLDEGVLGEAEAERRLLAWWAARP